MYMNLKPNKQKIISFNTTAMTSLGFIMVGTPPPTPPKIESLEEVQNVLLERRNKPVKRGGGGGRSWCRNGGGGLSLFYYFTVQSYLLCVRGK